MEGKGYSPPVDWNARVAVNMLNDMVSSYLEELDLDEAAESFKKRINEKGINLDRSFAAREWQRFYLYYRSCTPAQLLSMQEFPCSPLEYHDLNSLVMNYLKDLRLTREAALFESSTPQDNSVDYDSLNSIRWWIFPYSARISSIPLRRTRKPFAPPSPEDPSVPRATEDPPLKPPKPRLQTPQELLEDQIRIRDDVLKMLSSMEVLKKPQPDKSEKLPPSEGKTVATSELGLESVMPGPTAHEQHQSKRPPPSEGKTVATSELGPESVMPEPTAHEQHQSKRPPPSEGKTVATSELGPESVMPEPTANKQHQSKKPPPSEGKTVATSELGPESVMPEPTANKQHQSKWPPLSNGRIVTIPRLGLEVVMPELILVKNCGASDGEN